jgi:hypothetical protein
MKPCQAALFTYLWPFNDALEAHFHLQCWIMGWFMNNKFWKDIESRDRGIIWSTLPEFPGRAKENSQGPQSV